jgi:aspartate/methionine/tyrosine aminotransferase
MRPDLPADYKVVYYLLAIYGICVVPLSGFNTRQCGFRFTLLEQDEQRFETFLELMKEALSVWSQTPEVLN